MPTRFAIVLVIWTLTFSSVVKAQYTNTENGFFAAEQFVQANLYNGMLTVWGQDRRAWNLLLNVHACGSDQQSEKLSNSYESGQDLFTRAILNIAEQQDAFPTSLNKAVLSDVAQLAYRLFSASYAHGYARQVNYIDGLEPGIKDELCGFQVIQTDSTLISYSKSIDWQLTPFSGLSVSKFNQLIVAHAEQGYQAFNLLLSERYSAFDALVYSHAYQDTDAYDQLFFEVNGFQNVETFLTLMNGMETKLPFDLDIENDYDSSHAGFAYLTLASGYHWGTLSVLAMLEEEFPRLHLKTKSSASILISKAVSEAK